MDQRNFFMEAFLHLLDTSETPKASQKPQTVSRWSLEVLWASQARKVTHFADRKLGRPMHYQDLTRFGLKDGQA